MDSTPTVDEMMGSRPTAEQPRKSAFDAILVRNKISQYVQNLQENSAHQQPMPTMRILHGCLLYNMF